MPTKPLVLNETVSATNTLLTSIAENLAAIAAADSSNARLASLAKEIADEAKTIAMGATRAEVFDTTELMQNWLKDPGNAGKLKIGDNLYIKDTNVPDYWVSNVLTTPNDEGYYYEYAQLEIGKVNLSNVVKTDADDADTVDSVFGMLKGTPKNISSENLASVVAGQSAMTDKVKNEAIPTGGTYASTQLWAGGPHWAKWNVGANSETEYGDLFAWGATKPYRMNGTTVLDNTGDYAASKANTIQRDLNPNEDAATINMGAGWRMPTKAEFDALIANTDATWTTIGGVNGRKFADKRDANNYIFFPASGNVSGSSLDSRGSNGYYWARSFNSSTYAWLLGFYSSGQSTHADNRYNGFSVRGVRS